MLAPTTISELERLEFAAAACVPRANHNHHIVDQLLRAGIRLRSAGDTLLIHLLTDVL